jgi:SAM-dependent methyltransferase
MLRQWFNGRRKRLSSKKSMLLKTLYKPVYLRRIEVLSNMIASHLEPEDQVLDIGSGSGQLGKAILDHSACPERVEVLGCEKNLRGREAIETFEFDGYSIPASDAQYNVTILADVVHHEEEPDRLLKEVLRVTKRILIIKDHIPAGVLGYFRICFMDWAANKPYGVNCLFRYFTVEQWHKKYHKFNLKIIREETSIDLYPPVYNEVFGKKLQYFAVLRKHAEQVAAANP